MTIDTLKRVAALVGVMIVAAMVLGLVAFGLYRVWPRHDPVPAQTAAQDTRTARDAAAGIGEQVRAQNAGATLHLDVTTKGIRDAFDQLPAPAPSPSAGEPRALPAAPVDRLRDSLNEGAARANRAARPSAS